MSKHEHKEKPAEQVKPSPAAVSIKPAQDKKSEPKTMKKFQKFQRGNK